MQENDSTARAVLTPDRTTYRKKIKRAEKLTVKIVRLLEYDTANIGKLLLLIDLFEQDSHDAVFVNTLAASIRQLAYGLSSLADDQSIEFVSELKRDL
jgi:hypothetical protein